MKKSIITLAILMAATAAFANGGKAPSKPEPKAPDVKTPSTPNVGPKAPSTPPATASRTQSRADTPEHPCDRSWNRPSYCSVPVVDAVPAVPALPPADTIVAPLPQPVQVVTVVVHEACTQVNFAALPAPIKHKAKSKAKAKPKAAAPVQCGVVK